MTVEANGDRTLRSMTSAEYVRQVQRVATYLRRYADMVEREGLQIKSHKGIDHAGAARNVVSELQAFWGNVPLWNMLDAAQHADAAEHAPDA